MIACLQEQASRLKRHLIEHLNFRDYFGDERHWAVINNRKPGHDTKSNNERHFLPDLLSKHQVTKKVELPSTISESLVARSSHTMRVMKSVTNEGQIKPTGRVRNALLESMFLGGKFSLVNNFQNSTNRTYVYHRWLCPVEIFNYK